MVNYKPSALHGHEDTEPYIFWESRFWSLGVTWCHWNVTIGLVESTFLLVVNDDHKSILHRYGDTGLQRFWGHVTSSVTWPFNSAYVVSYWRSIVTMHLSCTVMEIWGPKYIGVTSLIFWGHVTSSVSGPSDSAWALSYWWSMMSMRLYCMGTEIRGFEDFGITSLTFWGHVTSSVTWPLNSAYVVPIGGPL